MRAVTYQSLLDRLAGYLAESDGLSVEDAALANQKINFFARLGWEHFFHPEITPIERRTFRPAYATGEVIAAGDERYFVPANNYFVALRSQPVASQPPATLSGGDYQTNLAWWAEADPNPVGDDWSERDFVLGDKTRNLDDGLIYQCHTAHTAVGSFDATKFGVLNSFVRSLSYDGTATIPASLATPLGRGHVTLANGIDSGSVTGLTLTQTPTAVRAWIVRPAGDLNLDVFIVSGSISAGGFDYELNGLTDGDDYELYWEASVPPLSGTLALSAGISSGSVSNLGLDAAPAGVTLWVIRPSGGLNLKAWPISGTLTADGFDFELDGITDSGDYTLAWQLSLARTVVGETPIGDVRYIWDRNPETNRAARPMRFRLRSDFIQVLGMANVVWVEFRQRVPVWSGAVRSDGVGYAAGVTLFDAATGDFWKTLYSVSAGESPTTTAAKWEQLKFPYYLSEFVVQSAYAMLTNREQQTPENFSIQMSAGYPLLLAEIDKIERQQGQVRQLNVVTGHNSNTNYYGR